MKVFFDTNVYVAEALLGETAGELIRATTKARWHLYASPYVLSELERVMVERLDCTSRFAALTRKRTRRRATLVEPPPSRHQVPGDPADSPILRAALAAGVDYLVTNDAPCSRCRRTRVCGSCRWATIGVCSRIAGCWRDAKASGQLSGREPASSAIGPGECHLSDRGQERSVATQATQTVFTLTNSRIPCRPSSRP